MEKIGSGAGFVYHGKDFTIGIDKADLIDR